MTIIFSPRSHRYPFHRIRIFVHFIERFKHKSVAAVTHQPLDLKLSQKPERKYLIVIFPYRTLLWIKILLEFRHTWLKMNVILTSFLQIHPLSHTDHPIYGEQEFVCKSVGCEPIFEWVPLLTSPEIVKFRTYELNRSHSFWQVLKNIIMPSKSIVVERLKKSSKLFG